MPLVDPLVDMSVSLSLSVSEQWTSPVLDLLSRVVCYICGFCFVLFVWVLTDGTIGLTNIVNKRKLCRKCAD